HESNEVPYILLKATYYAESSGQVAYSSYLFTTDFKAKVDEVQKAPNGQHLHKIKLEAGSLTLRDRITAMIDDVYRNEVIKNHTATHLLHQALRDVFGDHIQDRKSVV